MPLPKIREFFENRDDEKMIEILKEQKKQVEEERILKDRQIAVLKKEISISDNLEQPIRELANRNSLHAVMFLGKVGVSISNFNLQEGAFDKFSSVFVVIEPEDRCDENLVSLQGGNYLTLRFQGTHKDAKVSYIKMLKYMKERGYVLAGDSLEFVLIDYGLTNDISKFVTEIQIPYK